MPFQIEREFAENTTLHGISRIFSAKSAILKIIWSVVFLAAFGLFVWQFYDRIWTYFQFYYNTLVEVEPHSSLVFPAVTICNYNRFWESRVSDQYRGFLESLQGFADLADYYGDYESATDNENPGGTIDFGELDFEEFVQDAGFRLNESLLRCEWKGRKDSCTANNFTKVYIPEYGVCYTFNGWNSTNKVSQSIPGNGNGLSILLNIDQEDYTETYNQGHHEAGIRFVVHHTRDPPLIDTQGLAVPPGFHSYVSIRQNEFHNLPKPYGTCEPDAVQKDELYIYQDIYSKKQCLINCRLDFILDKCACRPLGYHHENNSIKLCSPSETGGCVKKALQGFKSTFSIKKCNCPTSCTEISYIQTLSMTVYPSEQIKGELTKSFLGTQFPPTKVNSSTDFNFGKNLVYLDLYYEELSVTKFKQHPAMTWSALLADLGGQMGLFLGMSAITATEVLDYIIRKVYRLLRGGQSDNNKVIELVST